MTMIYLRYSNGISPPLRAANREKPFQFLQPDKYVGFPVELEIASRGDVIQSECCVDVALELTDVPLEKDSEKLSELVKVKVKRFLKALHDANQRLLELISQELEIDEPTILTSLESQWSLDGKNWADFSYSIVFTGESFRPVYSLDSQWRNHIQSVLDLDEEPFVAFEHLHEARRHRGARFTWIDATIAAELAIKEALGRLEPRLSPLLLEVPAPPLHKLYGAILEEVAGERSPYVKQLQKVVETRNKLIHRPTKVELDPQAVVDYVAVVDRAIWHLVGLCRRTSDQKLHRAAVERSRKPVAL